MKNLLFLSAILFSFSSIAQTSSDDRPVRTCEVMPVFEDCIEEEGASGAQCTQAAIMAHISETVTYPQSAKDAGFEGTIYIKFIVEKDGTVSGVEVMRGLGDSESEKSLTLSAVNAVSTLPNFLPGSNEGEPVRVQYVVPVRFVIS